MANNASSPTGMPWYLRIFGNYLIVMKLWQVIAFSTAFMFLLLGGPLTIKWYGNVWGATVFLLLCFSIADLSLTVTGKNIHDYIKQPKQGTHRMLMALILIGGTIITVLGVYDFQHCCHYDRCGLNRTIRRWFKAYPECQTYYDYHLYNSFSVSRYPEASFMAHMFACSAVLVYHFMNKYEEPSWM